MLVAAADFGEEAEDFEVEPDHGDHESEGAVPLHIFGCAGIDAALDEVEVEDEVEGGDDDDEERDTYAEGAGVVDGEEADAEHARTICTR